MGDQAIVYPAHGAGSVCGSGMADREFSTVGHERRNNPLLQIEDRAAFIDRKVNENHYQPPYFRLMERLNLVGGQPAPQDESSGCPKATRRTRSSVAKAADLTTTAMKLVAGVGAPS